MEVMLSGCRIPFLRVVPWQKADEPGPRKFIFSRRDTVQSRVISRPSWQSETLAPD